MDDVLLTAQDMANLQTLINDFRHKEASALIRFMADVQQRARIAKAKATLNEAPASNGHDSNPYAAQA